MSTAQATPVPVTGTGAVYANPATLRGWSLFSTPGDTVTLFDNPSAASGAILAKIVIPAAGSSTVPIPHGLRAATGIYLSASGALTGSVWVG